jgi:hypothetical protein
MRDIRNAKISPRDRAICVNALDRILERKRILRMKPAPKAVDADEYREHQKVRKWRDYPTPIDLPPQATSEGYRGEDRARLSIFNSQH